MGALVAILVILIAMFLHYHVITPGLAETHTVTVPVYVGGDSEGGGADGGAYYNPHCPVGKTWVMNGQVCIPNPK